MPELPEVETIKNVIEPQIQGLTIENIIVNRDVIAHPTASKFCEQLTGQIFSSMGRRGKFLIFTMDSGDYIVLHLRMTGCLLPRPAGFTAGKAYAYCLCIK